MKKQFLRVLGCVGMLCVSMVSVSESTALAASGAHSIKSGWAVMFAEKHEEKQDDGSLVVKGQIAQVCTSQDGHHCVTGGKQTRTRHGEWTWFWPNGKTKAVRHFHIGQLHGVSKAWYPNGQLRWVEQYVAGKLEGERKEFFANGVSKTKENYRGGKLHGPYTSWWWNGKKSTEGSYEYGKPRGNWQSWYLTGHKKEQSTFKDGVLNGLFVQWWYVCRPVGCDSVKMMEGFYQKGKKQGRWLQGTFGADGQFSGSYTTH